ncbi:MAG TPA: hypothetical protein VN811_04150, partial [Thermoanaerobaculia bacterium]|nr:hypothetical protein [Thermoanaerobaculia bacterium]
IGVTGNVVTLQYSSACPTGISPAVFEIEREVPPLPAGTYELRATDSGGGFSGLAYVRANVTVAPPGSCAPTDTTLCLHDRRFAVTATWRDFAGHTGVGHALVPPGSDGSGLFWFFGAENAELTVKVLDGCAVNQHWWVFLASGSSVDYEVTVTDTRSGAQRKYTNPLGVQAPLATDLEAFAACTE